MLLLQTVQSENVACDIHVGNILNLNTDSYFNPLHFRTSAEKASDQMHSVILNSQLN